MRIREWLGWVAACLGAAVTLGTYMNALLASGAPSLWLRTGGMTHTPVALQSESGVFVLTAGLLYVAGLLAVFRWTDAHRADGTHRSRGRALP